MTGGRHIKLRELLLGFEGLALLRGLVDASDEDMAARIDEIRNIAVKLDEQPYASGLDVPELDPYTGYAYWSRTYDEGTNPLLVAEQPVVESIVASVPAGRALDAACGTGRHARHLARRHAVAGVDASPDMLERAHAAVPAARFVRGDLARLPMRDDRFDVVVCALALCHVGDLAAAVRELARVARHGARVVLTDPHPAGVAFLNQAFFPTDDGGIAFVRNHYHQVGAYIEAIHDAGLRILHCHEPTWEEEFVGGLVAQFAPDAMKQALVGLPFAIVWELEKP